MSYGRKPVMIFDPLVARPVPVCTRNQPFGPAPSTERGTALHYLPEMDPAVLLGSPTLAPLAVAARVAPGRKAAAERAGLLARSLAVIHDSAPKAQTEDLADAAAVLGGLYLDEKTV